MGEDEGVHPCWGPQHVLVLLEDRGPQGAQYHPAEVQGSDPKTADPAQLGHLNGHPDDHLHEAVEGDVLVVGVKEHVGDEPPGLFPPERVVDEEGVDGPPVAAKLHGDAQGGRAEDAHEVEGDLQGGDQDEEHRWRLAGVDRRVGQHPEDAPCDALFEGVVAVLSEEIFPLFPGDSAILIVVGLAELVQQVQ